MIDIENLIESNPEAQEGINETEDFLNGYIELDSYANLEDFKYEMEYEIEHGIED